MRAVTNPPNRKEETTQFTFFFTTVGNGKFVPVNPTVNAKATKAKAFESASTYLPKNRESEGLSILLGSFLQSPIHLFKATLRISIEALRHERNEQSCEFLVLNETDPFLI